MARSSETATPDEPDAPKAPENDGPSSHDTAGQFPADDVGAAPGGMTEGASSHDTAGQFPADEVADASRTSIADRNRKDRKDRDA